jgi:hypothetical protein
LTKNLAIFLLNKLKEFGITTTALYSCASISFKYYTDNTRVITSYKFYENDKELLKFACDAYQGGKFEVTSRGYYKNAIEYDISSAYPYEIANLKDITNAKIYRNREYIPEADYSFLRVKIYNPNGIHLPCGIMEKNVRIYPAGVYYLTITKAEYEYMLSMNIKMFIYEAYHLIMRIKKYPYRKLTNGLFTLKQTFKNKDEMLYSVTKIVANSFYGKTVQCIENWKKEINAGSGFNPIYGAIITANTRIKVTKLQNLLKESCLAVHTDSVIATEPVPLNLIHKKLGSFTYEINGDLILIACGMYQISNKCAYKGFKAKLIDKKKRVYDSWDRILSRNRNKSKIKYRQLYVESWCDAMAKNHERERINYFDYKNQKIIDLNCDVKRIWPSIATGNDLLTKKEQSEPRVLIENEPPKNWIKN